jgi:hypothetical protein
VYLRSRWLTCCHNTFSNQSHLVAKQENITGEKQVRKFGRQSISLMLRRVLLHAVNLRHGTDGFTSPPKEVRGEGMKDGKKEKGRNTENMKDRGRKTKGDTD